MSTVQPIPGKASEAVAPLSTGHYLVLALCFLINSIDGIDVLSISYTASALSKSWSLGAAEVGALLSAGLAGMTVGAMVLSPLADYIGRKYSILLCLAIITIGMAFSSVTTTFGQLLAARVLTGLGIGAITSNIIAIVYEFMPQHRRAFALGVLGTGFPLGAALGGSLAAWLIPVRGWHSVFVCDAALSIALIPLIFWALPESMAFIIEKRPKNALVRLNAARRKVALSPVSVLPSLPSHAQSTEGFAALLQTDSRRALIIWASVYLLFMASFYFMLSWAARLIAQLGYSPSEGIAFSAMITYGGVVGNLTAGFLSNRLGKRRSAVGITLILAIFIIAFPHIARTGVGMSAFALCLGWTMWASLLTMYTLTAGAFPAAVRSSGLGISLGAGRIGSVLGPYVGGLVLSTGSSVAATCLFLGVPALGAALVLALTKSDSEAFDSAAVALEPVPSPAQLSSI